MSTTEPTGGEIFEWYVEPDGAYVTRRTRAHSARTRLDDERATSLGVVIITTLFFVLFAAAVMVGGHAAIGPMLRSAMAARDGSRVTSDIVLPMPDGMFCRHMSFDNSTADLVDAGIEHCPSHIERTSPMPSRFEWGRR